MKRILVHGAQRGYRLVRPLIFLFKSEPVHDVLLYIAYLKARVPGVVPLMRGLFRVSHPSLEVTVAGIHFDNPIGLAAGFDYRAELSRLLPGLGFGFGTVGTLTHAPYDGNAKPRLGRLVKSRSLLVNKGFKNDGVTRTLSPYATTTFQIPIGVSIGRTNRQAPMTQAEAVEDVVRGFKDAEASGASCAYYELNISCPNLLHETDFYEPAHLEELLTAVTALKLNRPIFIKMPIDRSDEQLVAMLNVIMRFPIQGIIVGNLQKNRSHPLLVPEEVREHPKGFFSGKPTEGDSNHHITLAYTHSRGKLIVIGCGGVFTAEDAYTKIKAGASLIQLATGLVFEGPLVASAICADLPALLTRDGYTHYREAIGTESLFTAVAVTK